MYAKKELKEIQVPQWLISLYVKSGVAWKLPNELETFETKYYKNTY
jgi:hypothetical protein